MPQAVNRHLRHTRPGNKAAEPLRQAVREHGRPGVGGEHPPVLILPGVSQLPPPGVLPGSIFQQQHNSRSGDGQRPGRGGGLRCADIDPLTGQIVGGLADGDGMPVQVYVLPAEAQQLRPAQAGEKVEGDGGPPLDRLGL